MPLSSRHENVAPDTVEWNAKVADVVLATEDGPLSITVSGVGGASGVVAEAVPLCGDALPAPSTATTAYVCELPAATVLSV